MKRMLMIAGLVVGLLAASPFAAHALGALKSGSLLRTSPGVRKPSEAIRLELPTQGIVAARYADLRTRLGQIASIENVTIEDGRIMFTVRSGQTATLAAVEDAIRAVYGESASVRTADVRLAGEVKLTVAGLDQPQSATLNHAFTQQSDVQESRTPEAGVFLVHFRRGQGMLVSALDALIARTCPRQGNEPWKITDIAWGSAAHPSAKALRPGT